MKNFTTKLIISCTGVIFASFLVVYFLFNFLASSYIRAEAERELFSGVRDVTTAALDALPLRVGLHPGMAEGFSSVFQVTDVSESIDLDMNVGAGVITWTLPALGYNSIWVNEDFTLVRQAEGRMNPEHWTVNADGYWVEAPWLESVLGEYAFRVYVSQEDPAMPVDEDRETGALLEVVLGDRFTPAWGVELPETEENVDDHTLFFHGVTPHDGISFAGRRLYPLNVISTMERTVNLSHMRRPFFDVDMITLSHTGEVLSPAPYMVGAERWAEIQFLADFYQANRSRFAGAEMMIARDGGSSFYMQAAFQAAGPETFSVLLYTDISPAMAFTANMNRILGVLLAVSGLLSLTISIAMSARFKRAVGRLCRHAETIGQGNFTHTAGVFNDTEFNRLSKSMDNMSHMLKAYENSQKQFFQNASHEMRTPLMSIQGYAEGILGDIFDKNEAAGVILSEGQKMTDLVSELLYVSRMDSGEAETAPERLNVRDLLYECAERVNPIAQKEGKQVVVSVAGEDVFVLADEEKLERALLNVLSNGIRYAKSAVMVDYGVTGDKLEIVVEDDGPGIGAGDLPHVFERFYKGEGGNYGLGLAISRDIVKSLGGSITAENVPAPGSGAVFRVGLPVV